MGWIWRREGRRLAAAEVAIAGWADATPVGQRSRGGRPAPAARSSPDAGSPAVGNGVDLDGVRPDPGWPLPARQPQHRSLVFTGAMDYRRTSMLWPGLPMKCCPVFGAALPSATSPSSERARHSTVRHLAQRPGVLVTGRVPDVRPWLAHATMAVAPLRIARGVQNKVLEAMAMARPVLCTPAAAIGSTAVAGRDSPSRTMLPRLPRRHSRSCDDPQPPRSPRQGRARQRVEAAYGWPLRLAELDRVLFEATPS